jgi:Fe2+ or Zn2+ uptake regulation protein
MTRQRAAILEVIRAEPRHYTAEEIFHLAQKILPTISRATVYNNLNAMADEHLIRRICMADADIYDRSFEPHVHLVCTKCGGIKDMRLEGLAEQLEHALGQTVSSYEFKVDYVCEACRHA